MSNKTVGTNPASVAPPMKPHYSNSIRTNSGPLLFIADKSRWMQINKLWRG